jgi:hypothetical protein
MYHWLETRLGLISGKKSEASDPIAFDMVSDLQCGIQHSARLLSLIIQRPILSGKVLAKMHEKPFGEKNNVNRQARVYLTKKPFWQRKFYQQVEHQQR